MLVRADRFYRGKGQGKGQIYNENKQRHKVADNNCYKFSCL